MVKEALRDLLSIQKTSVSIENIQKVVADYYKIKVADMYSKRRPANIAHPRQVQCTWPKNSHRKAFQTLVILFGGRDHTTVLHAVRKISEQRQHNTELNRPSTSWNNTSVDKSVHNPVQILCKTPTRTCDQLVNNMNNWAFGHELSQLFYRHETL